MAKVSGGAAYSGYQKLDNGISQGLQHWGGVLAQKNVAKKLADEREGIRKAKALSDWETKYELDASEFEGKHTGFQSYDDIKFDYGQHSMKKYQDAYRTAQEAYNNPSEKRKAEAQMRRYKNDFKRISEGDQLLADNFKVYQEAVAKGEVSGANGKFDSILKAVYQDKTAAIRYGDNDELIVTGRLENGDPFEVPFNNITDGTFSWFKAVDYESDNGLVNNLTKRVGTYVEKKVIGDNIVESDLWQDGNNDDIKEMINTSLSDTDVADLYNRDHPDYHYDDDTPPTDEIRNAVIDRVFGDVKNNYDQKYSEKQRQMSVSEKEKQNALDRGIKRQGQKDANNRHQKGLKNAWNIANLKKNKDGSGMSDEEKLKDVNMYAWKLAGEIASLPEEKQNDTEVGKILKREGIGYEGDWNVFVKNQIDVGSGSTETEDVMTEDRHGMAEAITKVLGVGYDRASVVLEKEKGLDDRKKPKTVIKQSDIASKAQASGYTVEEYTKLLTDKGIKIE